MTNPATPNSPSELVAQLWDVNDELDDLTRELARLAARPEADKFRKACVHEIRRLRNGAMELMGQFDAGPAFDMYGPWRPVETTDLESVLGFLLGTFPWLGGAIMEAAQSGDVVLRSSVKSLLYGLASSLKSKLPAFGIEWEDVK